MLLDPSIRLRDAVVEGNLLIVKRLLRRYPELLTNIDPSNGWSSLHYASYHGRYLVCVLLIQMGHDKQEILRTFKNNTCVHLALLNGYEQTTHLLLQHFPQLIDQKGSLGRTPTHIACMRDHHQCLNLLIGVGALLSQTDDNGDTPLHICLQYGSTNCMKLLLQEQELGAVKIRNKQGWRPSDMAETFELQKLFKKTLKEVQSAGVTRKPSFQSFRTPVLASKFAFDDGPSPVLTMNSPYSLYSPTGPLPHLPYLSTSRRASVNNSVRTPLGQSTSFIPMLQTRDSSSLTNSTGSSSKVDNEKFQRTSSTITPTEDNRKENDGSRSKSIGIGIIKGNTMVQSNNDLVNKYVNASSEMDIRKSRPKDDYEIHNGVDSKSELNRGRNDNSSRKPMSLLAIPVAKLRTNFTNNSSDTSET